MKNNYLKKANKKIKNGESKKQVIKDLKKEISESKEIRQTILDYAEAYVKQLGTLDKIK